MVYVIEDFDIDGEIYYKKTFDACLDSIKCVENQLGGDNNTLQDNLKIYKITYYENKLNKIYINLSSIL